MFHIHWNSWSPSDGLAGTGQFILHPWLVCFIVKPVNTTIPKGLTHGLGQTFEIF